MNNLLAFFGLREDPFRLTPDPGFFFPSSVHQEALHSLEYIVRNREGFCMVTGEPGTGKTTLVSVFREQWRDRAEIALVLTPRLSPDEFLMTVFEALQLHTDNKNKNELLHELKQLLIEKYFAGRYVVIIVDEAHNLTAETLEELRLLSNLETDKEKLLQIILIGQPELEQRLAQPQLRQLDQRITERIRLRPLTAQESRAYIQHRLGKAGKHNVRLTAGALRRVYRFSRGIPRLVNLVLSRTIMAAYIDHDPVIRERHIVYAIRYLAGRRSARRISVSAAQAVGLAAVFVLVLAAAAYRLMPVRDDAQAHHTVILAPEPVDRQAVAVSTTLKPEQTDPPAAPAPGAMRDSVRAVIKYENVNVRMGPGRLTPRIGTLYKGTRITPLDSARDDNGTVWYKVFESAQGAGWVSEEVLVVER